MADLQQSSGQQHHAVAVVLTRLQRELQRLGLWDASPPADHQLTSEQPFSWDTLGFHQWLQWRFLPRMDDVLAGREEWPLHCAIHPYAEECLAVRPEDTRELLFLIETLDQLVSGDGSAAANAGTH